MFKIKFSVFQNSLKFFNKHSQIFQYKYKHNSFHMNMNNKDKISSKDDIDKIQNTPSEENNEKNENNIKVQKLQQKASLKNIYQFFKPYLKSKSVKRLLMFSFAMTIISKGFVSTVKI